MKLSCDPLGPLLVAYCHELLFGAMSHDVDATMYV